MPTNRKIIFSNDSFYHVFNRGVDRRIIFKDTRDYKRFYRALFLLNNSNYASVTGRVFNLVQKDLLSLGEKREPLVHILGYCLRPTHFHLFLEQIVADGIPKFLQRLLCSYALYFNTKHERTGRLFEGPFKAVHVEREAHFEHLIRYIHLNALDEDVPQWRTGTVSNWKMAEQVLDRYPWSSHCVYHSGIQDLPVVEKSLLGDIFRTSGEYQSFLRRWGTRAMNDVKEITTF